MTSKQTILLVCIYTACYLASLNWFQYQMDADTIGYIAAAEHYAEGNFQDAINGYWSPLLSWLLVPFILIGSPILLAIKLINLLAAIICLVGIHKIIKYIQPQTKFTLFTYLFSGVHVLMYALCYATPDVIATTCWLWVIALGIKLYTQPSYLASIGIGIVAALSYFSKSYHLYAFTLLILVVVFFITVQKKSIHLLKYIGIASCICFILSSIWIGILHYKYGIYTPTLAAQHNINTSANVGINAPQIGSNILSIDYSTYTYSAWEFVPVYNSYIHETIPPNYNRITQNILPNLLKTVRYYYIEFILFIISAFLFFYHRKKKEFNLATFIFFSIIIYPLGYLFTSVDFRYLLAPLLLSNIVLLAYLDQVKPLVQKIALVLIFCSCVVAVKRTISYPYKGADFKNYSVYFKQNSSLSDYYFMSSPSVWSKSISLAYFCNCKFYDCLQPQLLKQNIPLLQSKNIKYFFCKNDELKTVHVANLRYISIGEYSLITLY